MYFLFLLFRSHRFCHMIVAPLLLKIIAVPYIYKYYTEPLSDLSPLHCFLNFITGMVHSILSHITPIFYPLLSLYLVIWPPTRSMLSRSNSQSSPGQQESYLLYTLSKKWLVGWNITVNTMLIQRISYLFSTCWYFKSHKILFHCLNPFCLYPATDHIQE